MGRLLGLLTNVKLLAVIGSLSGLVALLNYVDSNGYNRAVQECTEANAKALKKATDDMTEKAYKEMQEALDKQAKVHENEIKFLENKTRTEVVTKEVIKYVDKIEIVDVCSTVNDDIMQLLNETIDKHNSSTKG